MAGLRLKTPPQVPVRSRSATLGQVQLVWAAVPVIVATIVPKPDQFDAVEEVLTRVIPEVHSEDGCELYALHRGKDRFVFVEKWRDMAALGAHGSGPNIKALNAGLKGLVSGPPDVQILEAVPAGEPGKGAV
jgi:quinol monooxygenase YgiN